MITIGRVHAQDQLGSRGDSQGNLGRVETVDRHTETSPTQRFDGIANAVPGYAGVAAQVDHVGSVADELPGLPSENTARQSRHVIDLGQNLDVIGAISLALCMSLTEMARQVAQILGADLNRNSARFLENGSQVAPAMARQDDA